MTLHNETIIFYGSFLIVKLFLYVSINIPFLLEQYVQCATWKSKFFMGKKKQHMILCAKYLPSTNDQLNTTNFYKK